jgi:hypothetical protein
MQSASPSYVRVGLAVNTALEVRTLEAAFFIVVRTCEETDKTPAVVERAHRAKRSARDRFVLGLSSVEHTRLLR